MKAYVEFEILEGAYEISCPDAMCPAQGIVSMSEIGQLTTGDLLTKHNRYRLNRGECYDESTIEIVERKCEEDHVLGA